jgi:phosphoribosylaminoimidazole carboxylase PurE protein
MSTSPQPLVSIVLGSKSDQKHVEPITCILDSFEVEYEVKVISAHRLPDVLAKYTQSLHRRGVKVVIGIAGMSAALPGCLAAHTNLPVIGVPAGGGAMNGQDALLSISQMPKGVPVACMAVNGSQNAALFALRILATSSDKIRLNYIEWKAAMQRKCKEDINELNNSL